MARQESSSGESKWHKNYTRLMPYYYVNKKAKLVSNGNEKIVRVRKVIKSTKELIIEVAEKLEHKKAVTKTKNEKTSKRLVESSLTSGWDDLEEISYQEIKSRKWSLNFIR